MSLRSLGAAAIATCAALGIVAVIAQDVMPDPSIEGMSPEEKVEFRQATMQENAATMGAIGSMAPADVVAAADVLIQNFTDLPVAFAPDTIVGDSRALPLIWEEKEAFDAILADVKEHAIELRAAAEAGDTAAIAAQIEEIGGYCDQCHSKYRGS